MRDSSYLFSVVLWARTLLAVRSATADRGDADGNDPRSLGWRYTRHAIRYMQYVAQRGGATLVIVPIIKHRPRTREILAETAAEHGVSILDTSRLSAGDASLWLPRDGHLSPAGARLLARIESEYLMGSPPSK